MAWAAVLAAVPSIVQAGTSVAGGATNQKDAERFATAQKFYSGALAGDKDDECALRHLSGRYGCATCGRHGQACGFATQAAKDYTGKLYDQFLAVKTGNVQAGTPIPLPPVQTGVPVTVQATTGPQGSGVTVEAGPNTLQVGSGAPLTTQQRNQMFLIVGLVVVVGVGALFLMRRGG